MAEKAKRPPNPFDICPKHKGFYKTCGCNWQKGKKKADTPSRDNEDQESE